MKMQAIFDIIQDAKDVLSFFEGVESEEQMISRLERMKRKGTDDFNECIDSLRDSVDTALEANLELGGSLGDESDTPDDIFAELGISDDELDAPPNPPKEQSGDQPIGPMASQEKTDT